MQEYKIKRTVVKDLEKNMVEKLEECFELKPEEKDGHYIISYGVLKNLDVCLGKTGKTLIVDTESRTGDDISDTEILDTNRRFRKYLDAVTGYSSKERAKKAKEEAKNA